MRLIPILAFALLSLVLALSLLGKSKPTSRDGLSEKTTALPAFALSSLDGKTQWSEKNARGHVTVMNFFASWCAPCAAEMPELVALKKQFPTIQFAGMVWADTPEVIAPFLKTHGNPFDHVWLDKNGEAAISLGIKGIPETFVIDHAGTVRLRIAGIISPEMREGALTDLLNELLAEEKNAGTNAR
jgi:cytochrome c biogenesis protein CcmG/thiol:disulfide interchange protein DsbE